MAEADVLVEEEREFYTKDYWLIIGLVSLDMPILRVECVQDKNGQDYLVWWFPMTEQVRELERSYNLGKPIMVDLQRTRAAAEVFKRNLQYYRIR